MAGVIAAPARAPLAVRSPPSSGRDQLKRLRASVTAAGLTLDDDAPTVLFGVYEQSGPVSTDILAVVRAGRNALSVATPNAPGDLDRRRIPANRAVDLGLDLALWMIADPPPAPTLVRLSAPPQPRSLRPVLALTRDTEIEPVRYRDATVSTWLRGAKVSGWPLLEDVQGQPRDPRPESEVLARGHVAVSVARWLGERWLLDAATMAWSGRLTQVMASRWSVGPSRCDCCL